MKRRAQGGFTLVELMVVLVLIAVLTMLATVSTESPGNPRSAADRVTGMVQFARLRAEARRSTHIVRFESAQLVSIWESVLADGVSPKPGFVPVTTVNQIETFSIPSGVVLWSADPAVLSGTGANPAINTNLGTPFDITINPDGSSSGGTIFFRDGETGAEKYRVFVYTVTGTALSREDW